MPKLTSDTMLSCSQLPSLFGVSPYSSPNDVLMFCMKSILGEDARTQAGEAADWGNALEPAIIAEMAKRLGIDRYVMPDKAFQHPNLALAASADAIAYIDKPMVINHDPSKGIYVVDGDSIELTGNGVLESKLTRGHAEEVLPLYRGPIQVQGVMMCTTLHWAAIGCLYSGVELRIFLFKPHAETMAQIENLAIDFQGRLTTFEETGEAQYYPAADSKDANRIWPTAREEEVQLGIDAEDLVADIVLAKNKIASIQEDIDMWEKDLKVMMKDYSSAKVGHWSIKWPMRHYKATAEKITPPKEAYSVRQSTLTIKESK
jgi:predicted phage-related endonuclease